MQISAFCGLRNHPVLHAASSSKVQTDVIRPGKSFSSGPLCTRPTFARHWQDFGCHQIARLHTHKAMGSRRQEHDARILHMLLRCRCRRNHVQQNASASFCSTDAIDCFALLLWRRYELSCVCRTQSLRDVASGLHMQINRKTLAMGT